MTSTTSSSSSSSPEVFPSSTSVSLSKTLHVLDDLEDVSKCCTMVGVKSVTSIPKGRSNNVSCGGVVIRDCKFCFGCKDRCCAGGVTIWRDDDRSAEAEFTGERLTALIIISSALLNEVLSSSGFGSSSDELVSEEDDTSEEDSSDVEEEVDEEEEEEADFVGIAFFKGVGLISRDTAVDVEAKLFEAESGEVVARSLVLATDFTTLGDEFFRFDTIAIEYSESTSVGFPLSTL